MRRLFAVLLLLTLMLMPHAMGAHEEKPITTTVMIYMCGSDLESRHGAATADIEEMLASKFNTDRINVVLLLGGSRQWQMGFDSDRVTVAEIGKRGLRTLALWNPMNMSDPNTLRNFIRYASERYPADRYGLILWDHGGGINGGVCHDELHPGDALTPNGIRSAVTNSGVGFEWIGFDACLMGNLETAVILQDCANYMIASEESEPACGWNYSFLYGLEKDADGAATGRRIVNSFMKPARNSSDTFTLSCIDLSRIGRLEEYLDRYASHLSALLNMENFSDVAIARRDSLSFGRAIYDSRQDYDLVDLGSLLAHFTHLLPDEGAAVLNELSAAVVANRSNKADTTGLSVYHPYYNKVSDAALITEDYSLRLDDHLQNYSHYLKGFGHLLRNDNPIDWRGLETVYAGTDEMGNALFTCVLTDAQVEAFSAATAAVLSEKVHEDYGVTDDMARIWSVSEVTLEDNVLTAAVPRKHLCVVDSDTGAILADDLDHVTDADGTLMVRAVYRPYSQYAESLSVVYHLKVDPETDKVTVAAIYEQQDARYTQRTPVSRRRLQSEKWETVSFTTDLRCPVYINGALAGYDDWTKAEGVKNNVRLPVNWAFEIRDDNDPTGCTVSFQITDTRNNTYAAAPTLMDPTSRYEHGRVGKHRADLDFTLIATRYPATDSYGMELVCRSDLRNAERLILRDVTIDGTLIGDIRVVRSPDEPLLFMLSADHAGTVHAFDTVALRLEILDRDGQHTVIPLSFDFETPMVFDAPEAEVLAEAEADGLTVQLLAVEEGGYGQDLSLRLNIINDTDEARSELSSVDCLFNGCLVSTAQCIETIPAHSAVLAPLDCVFAMTTDNDTLLCRDLNGYYEIEHVEAIRLVGDEIDFELTLEDAYDLTWLGENGFTATLIADDEVTVGLAEIAFSAGEARLILDLANNGDEPLSLCLTDGLWDDVAAEGISAPILLQPGERALTAMTLECAEAEKVPRQFTVSLSDGETAILTLQFDLDESLSVTDGIVPPERYELTVG